MQTKPFTLLTILALLSLVTTATTAYAGGDGYEDSNRHQAPISERTLRGTYVFSGQVLLNPVVNPVAAGNPPRALITCFSVGEIHFDGRGHTTRNVEIQCPTTPSLLAAGLGAPPPLGEPTPGDLARMGATMTSSGSYELNADGRGSLRDTGVFRLGPIPGNPASGDLHIRVSSIRGGLAHKVHILLKQQSVQPPGAPMLMNSDIGAAFVAYRR